MYIAIVSVLVVEHLCTSLVTPNSERVLGTVSVNGCFHDLAEYKLIVGGVFTTVMWSWYLPCAQILKYLLKMKRDWLEKNAIYEIWRRKVLQKDNWGSQQRICDSRLMLKMSIIIYYWKGSSDRGLPSFTTVYTYFSLIKCNSLKHTYT